MKTFKNLVIVMVVLSGLLLIGVTHRTIHDKEVDPTGKYTAIVSYRTYLSLIPMMPGSSGDKAGFVKIVDVAGKSYGEIPVPMLQMAEIEWHASGAEIFLIGEWDFAKKTCYYWSEDQEHQIFVRR